jgi:tRNA pseudouridine38-40 synthase
MTAKTNIRLILAFEGTAYHGWQMQGDLPTLQGLLSEAIARITGEQVSLTGSGRTDAGTHARRLVANFLTGSRIPPAQLARGLNSMLPRDVRVLSARRVPPGFHARRNAISKAYRYQIYLGPVLLPHLAREYYHYPHRIGVGEMAQAARLFEGEHDFASFAKTASLPSNTIRRIFRCELKKQGYRLHLTVEGSGFLHHMVRNMAGTLLEVGRGSMGLREFRELFVKRDRKLAGFTAPAHGLVLLKVRY